MSKSRFTESPGHKSESKLLIIFTERERERESRRSPVVSASDSRARGPGFDTRSGHILLFLLPLMQEGQLSVTGESMCTKYWLTLGGFLSRKCVFKLSDRPDVYRGRKTTQQQRLLILRFNFTTFCCCMKFSNVKLVSLFQFLLHSAFYFL